MARSLIVLPDDSTRRIVGAIEQAKRSLRIKMFAFSDATLLNAVLAAKRRGVAVQVMLNPERRSGERDNDHTRRVLARGHVAVKDANPEFDLTHEKSMIVDDHTGFVQSCNWVTNTLTKARDYAVVTTSRHDVADLLEGFEADWHHGHSRRAAVRISSGVRAPGRASVSSSTTRSTGCGSRTNGSRTWR